MATSPPSSPSRGYETSDARPRALLYFFLILTAALVFTALGMKWLFGHFANAQNAGAFVSSPFGNVRPLPSGPRLQEAPQQDIQLYRESQRKLLDSYGWVDRRNGVARIPIDRAMELLLKQGLPTRQSPSALEPSRSTRASQPRNKISGIEARR